MLDPTCQLQRPVSWQLQQSVSSLQRPGSRQLQRSVSSLQRPASSVPEVGDVCVCVCVCVSVFVHVCKRVYVWETCAALVPCVRQPNAQIHMMWQTRSGSRGHHACRGGGCTWARQGGGCSLCWGGNLRLTWGGNLRLTCQGGGCNPCWVGNLRLRPCELGELPEIGHYAKSDLSA